MIKIIEKEEMYIYDMYHILRAFYPGSEIDQTIDSGVPDRPSPDPEGRIIFLESISPKLMRFRSGRIRRAKAEKEVCEPESV